MRFRFGWTLSKFHGFVLRSHLPWGEERHAVGKMPDSQAGHQELAEVTQRCFFPLDDCYDE